MRRDEYTYPDPCVRHFVRYLLGLLDESRELSPAELVRAQRRRKGVQSQLERTGGHRADSVRLTRLSRSVVAHLPILGHRWKFHLCWVRLSRVSDWTR